jgi:F0F1-type ATP synthase membrane subunit a
MPFIEFFSIFTKPLALMIRLFANNKRHSENY